MSDLLTIFMEELPQRLRGLRKAVASLNATHVVMEAYALKGMLSSLTAVEADETVAELERLGRNNEMSKFLESFPVFEAIAKELSRQVEDGVAEVSEWSCFTRYIPPSTAQKRRGGNCAPKVQSDGACELAPNLLGEGDSQPRLNNLAL